MIIRPAAISAMASSTVLNGGCGETTRGWGVIFLEREICLEAAAFFTSSV
jgi:hypothetical protein